MVIRAVPRGREHDVALVGVQRPERGVRRPRLRQHHAAFEGEVAELEVAAVGIGGRLRGGHRAGGDHRHQDEEKPAENARIAVCHRWVSMIAHRPISAPATATRDGPECRGELTNAAPDLPRLDRGESDNHAVPGRPFAA